ncbi:unnamed protein product [Cochlearia groenlandica]
MSSSISFFSGDYISPSESFVVSLHESPSQSYESLWNSKQFSLEFVLITTLSVDSLAPRILESRSHSKVFSLSRVPSFWLLSENNDHLGIVSSHLYLRRDSHHEHSTYDFL